MLIIARRYTYRAALQEYRRERVPLQWAATQTSLGTVLSTLGERAGDRVKFAEEIARTLPR